MYSITEKIKIALKIGDSAVFDEYK